MAFENPTQAQINAVTAAPDSMQGNVLTNRGNDGYIFASGILSPEHSSFLSYQFPQYTATAILDRLGRYEPISQSAYSWSEMNRTRSGATVTAGGGVAGATLTLTTDYAVVPGAGSDGYFIVGDTIRSSTSIQMIVDAVGVAGNFQTLTVSRTDGLPFTATDVIDTDSIGHIANAHEELSFGPKGRKNLPNERFGRMQTMRRSCTVSGDALSDKTYLNGGKSWYYEEEMITMEEFSKDRENALMFEQISPEGAARSTTEGILTAVMRGGIRTTYAGLVSEASIQAHITALRISSPATEYFVPCGMQYLSAVQVALRDYHVNGGVNYGTFGNADMIGISVGSYKFMDCTVHFVHYPTFDDPETLPHTGAATATRINYSNYSLWLNLGSQRGKKLISIKYKELDGYQRKFQYKHLNGMAGTTSDIASSIDGKTGELLSDLGTCVRNLNMHGAHYANA